jgi:hypothetical protein
MLAVCHILVYFGLYRREEVCRVGIGLATTTAEISLSATATGIGRVMASWYLSMPGQGRLVALCGRPWPPYGWPCVPLWLAMDVC